MHSFAFTDTNTLTYRSHVVAVLSMQQMSGFFQVNQIVHIRLEADDLLVTAAGQVKLTDSRSYDFHTSLTKG